MALAKTLKAPPNFNLASKVLDDLQTSADLFSPHKKRLTLASIIKQELCKVLHNRDGFLLLTMHGTSNEVFFPVTSQKWFGIIYDNLFNTQVAVK